jgi:hypothetical protein
MIVYLAGGVTGNLIKEWQIFMKLHLASLGTEIGSGGRLKDIYKNDMKLFIAGNDGFRKERFDLFLKDLYILESYHYVIKQKWMFPLINEFKGFLLDSGAFTFMTSLKGKSIDWEVYVINYGNFIKLHDIKYFFELDIDPIVGLKEVERLRHLLEKTSERKCIPVWHKSRGLDYWKQMCKDYDYVAIGGIVTQEIKRSEYDVFYPLLKIAKENNCKVHGLGFTNLKGMVKYKFYSVDSTSWLSGNKFGAVYLFDGETMQKQNKQLGQRVKTNKTAIHNFTEWVKFSKYAEQNL